MGDIADSFGEDGLEDNTKDINKGIQLNSEKYFSVDEDELEQNMRQMARNGFQHFSSTFKNLPDSNHEQREKEEEQEENEKTKTFPLKRKHIVRAFREALDTWIQWISSLSYIHTQPEAISNDWDKAHDFTRYDQLIMDRRETMALLSSSIEKMRSLKNLPEHKELVNVWVKWKSSVDGLIGDGREATQDLIKAIEQLNVTYRSQERALIHETKDQLMEMKTELRRAVQSMHQKMKIIDESEHKWESQAIQIWQKVVYNVHVKLSSLKKHVQTHLKQKHKTVPGSLEHALYTSETSLLYLEQELKRSQGGDGRSIILETRSKLLGIIDILTARTTHAIQFNPIPDHIKQTLPHFTTQEVLNPSLPKKKLVEKLNEINSSLHHQQSEMIAMKEEGSDEDSMTQKIETVDRLRIWYDMIEYAIKVNEKRNSVDFKIAFFISKNHVIRSIRVLVDSAASETREIMSQSESQTAPIRSVVEELEDSFTKTYSKLIRRTSDLHRKVTREFISSLEDVVSSFKTKIKGFLEQVQTSIEAVSRDSREIITSAQMAKSTRTNKARKALRFARDISNEMSTRIQDYPTEWFGSLVHEAIDQLDSEGHSIARDRNSVLKEIEELLLEEEKARSSFQDVLKEFNLRGG